MTWNRFDDRWDIGSKMVRAFAKVGDAGPNVWTRAVTTSNRELTDGVLHVDVLFSLTKHKKPAHVVDVLVEVGALHDEAGRLACGRCAELYPPLRADERLVHDFLDWNPSKAEVEERRRAKQDAGKKGGRASGEARKQKQPDDERASASEQTGSTSEARASRLVRPRTNENEPLSRSGSDPDPDPISPVPLSPLLPPENRGAAAPSIQDMVVTGLRAHQSLAHAFRTSVVEALEGDLGPRALKPDEIAQAFAWAAKRATSESAAAGGGPLVVERVVDLVLSAFDNAKTVGRRKLDARSVAAPQEADPEVDEARRAASLAAKKRLGGGA
jgi:hypothetical protein